MNDTDLCDKAFLDHNAFSAGIYSLGLKTSLQAYNNNNYGIHIGCACDKNITLGFKLMLNKEGPKNLSIILQY